MREDQIDQAERRATFANDRKVREQQQQGTTFKAFADAEARVPGRFEHVAAAHVVGTTPDPAQAYPAASIQSDPVGIEPPLGYRVDEMIPLESSAVPVVEDTPSSEPDDAPSNNAPSLSLDVEQRGAGLGLSQEERDNG